jgi:ribulose-5-phosphate 4-epimerase/fuculose-1-phosphate aldolase
MNIKAKALIDARHCFGARDWRRATGGHFSVRLDYGHCLITRSGKDRSRLSENDLVSVPSNTRHWFGIEPNPLFTAIRLFNNPEGRAAGFTGDDIASRFPLPENR